MLSWMAWAVVLIVQNISFTYVSRARNSGSLYRHMKAAIFSNLTWFISQLIIVGKLMDLITGKHGYGIAIYTALFYTAFTLTGSLIAHYMALRSEKGMDAVGANKRFKQVTVEEWDNLVAKLA